MGIGLTKVKHVKLPVSDLQRSVSWYQSLVVVECDRGGSAQVVTARSPRQCWPV